jgi:hypothetical protein
MMRNALCVLTLTCAAGAATAENAAPTDDVAALRTRVADLEARLAQVERPEAWLTEQRAAQIRTLVQDVLADADSRANLADAGLTAGWDKGFYIASPDGKYKLKIGGQIQQRFVYNHQDDSPTDDNRSGFEVRRAKLILSGNAVDPTWSFDVQLAADRTSGNVQLEDAGWIMKDLGDGWKIKVGQMKAPFLREEVLSSTRMLAVERSLLNSTFTAGTVQGVQVGWEGDKIHAYAMYHDGNNSKNTAWSVEDTEYAFSGRVEWLANGEWKNLMDYDSFKDEGAGLVIGGAVNYSVQEFGTTFAAGPPATGNNNEVQNLGLTVDATIDFGGASLAGAFIYRNLKTDTGSPADIDRDQLGFLIRGGFFLTDDWEMYGQYEWGDADTTNVEDLSVVTIGATRYWARHNLKWQSDIGYGINEVASTWASDAAGWRTDASGNDGQLVIRSQLQLLF